MQASGFPDAALNEKKRAGDTRLLPFYVSNDLYFTVMEVM